MTIPFKNDTDVIVYTFEKIKSYATDTQDIFHAQSVWWRSLIIGLQQGLITHIDNLKIRSDIENFEIQPAQHFGSNILDSAEVNVPDIYSAIHPSRLAGQLESDDISLSSRDELLGTTQSNIHNKVIEKCDLLLEQSNKKRKAIGRKTPQASRVVKQKAQRQAKKTIRTFGTRTAGIDGSELTRRKAAGECQRCAWPKDRKGSHKTIDSFRWKRVEKGTAPFPKKKRYNKE
jgi:hypothetical protein